MGSGAPLNLLLISRRPLILGALQAFFNVDARRFAVTRSLNSVREAAALDEEQAVKEDLALKEELAAPVVVLDTAGESLAGVAAVTTLLAAHPGWRILALTDGSTEGVWGVLRAGAIGAISHSSEPAELVEAAAATAVMPLVLGADVQFLLAARALGRDPGPAGRSSVPSVPSTPPGGAEGPPKSADHPAAAAIPLTEQETEAVRHLLHGLGNHQIAERMFVSASSVKDYLKSARRKVGARDRAHLVVRAFELGWGHLGSSPGSSPGSR